MSREGNGQSSILAAVGYPHRFDGAAQSFLNLVVRLPDVGYRPIVLFTDSNGVCVRAFREAGVDVRVLDVPEAFNRFDKVWLRRAGAVGRLPALASGLPRVALQIRRIIRDEEIEIVHFNESRALFLCGWLPWLTRLPSILHVRGSLHPLPAPLQYLAQAIPTRMILVGSSLEDEIEMRFRHKAVAIHNSVSTEDAPEPLPDDGVRPLIVLTLAAFEGFKGYHHLVEAAAEVTKRLAPRRVEFRWFGNVVNREYVAHLHARIDTLGLSNIVISDWIPDVSDEIRRADVVVLPTVKDEVVEISEKRVRLQSSEGVPRCLLEAAAMGRPTVSTRVGGIPEAVLDGVTGTLVPPSDPAALAGGISDLLRSPERRSAFGQQGYSHVRTEFSHDGLVEQTARVYRECLRDAGRARNPPPLR